MIRRFHDLEQLRRDLRRLAPLVTTDPWWHAESLARILPWKPRERRMILDRWASRLRYWRSRSRRR